MTVRRSTALLFAVVVSAALLILPAPRAVADSCTQYQGLTDAGYPGRALALIEAEAARLPSGAQPPCETQRDNAEEAVAQAEAVMAGLDDEATPEAQQEVVDKALAIDRENARALAKQAALAAPSQPVPLECTTYADIITAAYPQRALAFIDAQTKRLPSGSAPPCAAQRVLAEQQVAAAELEMSELEEDADSATQRKAVDAALKADKENARAVALDKELDADEVLASRVSTNWKTFWDEQLAPAKNGVLALLGWLLGAAIGLKLLTRVLRNKFLPNWGTARPLGCSPRGSVSWRAGSSACAARGPASSWASPSQWCSFSCSSRTGAAEPGSTSRPRARRLPAPSMCARCCTGWAPSGPAISRCPPPMT